MHFDKNGIMAALIRCSGGERLSEYKRSQWSAAVAKPDTKTLGVVHDDIFHPRITVSQHFH